MSASPTRLDAIGPRAHRRIRDGIGEQRNEHGQARIRSGQSQYLVVVQQQQRTETESLDGFSGLADAEHQLGHRWHCTGAHTSTSVGFRSITSVFQIPALILVNPTGNCQTHFRILSGFIAVSGSVLVGDVRPSYWQVPNDRSRNNLKYGLQSECRRRLNRL